MLENVTTWISNNPATAIVFTIGCTMIAVILGHKLFNSAGSKRVGISSNVSKTTGTTLKPILLKKWRCGGCDKDYDTKEEADGCCEEKSTEYTCGRCGEIYDTLAEVEACCPTKEVEMWKCASCEEVWEEKDDAKECCA